MSLRIAMTGSHGLIGSALAARFLKEGHSVTRIVRSSGVDILGQHSVVWDPAKQVIDAERLAGHEVVIHLAGANLASQRWTPEFKKKLRESRLQSTAFLSQTLTKLPKPPQVFLCASAVGYYGNRPSSETVTEATSQGWDFLSDLCVEWEKAAHPASARGIRVVNMRFGMVLSEQGGGLAKMLPVFRLGWGGNLGSGKQMMSWISIEDVPDIILHLIENRSIFGPVNVVAPQPLSNEEFTKILGRVIHRPTVFPTPDFVMRFLFGEMADALLLGGARVLPKKLQDSGYRFRYPDLKPALEKIL